MILFRRLLFWLALAVLGALLWQALVADPGEVFVRFRGQDYTTTVPVALTAVVLAWVAIWLLAKLLLMPFRAWRRHTRKLTRARLIDGLAALHDGRWLRAEKLLERVAADERLRVPARLAAARAAEARNAPEAVAQHLAAIADSAPVAVALFEAERLLAAGRAGDALAKLDAAGSGAPLPPRGLILRAEALSACGRGGEAYGLLGPLRQTQALDATALADLEARLAAASLREAEDPNALADRWDSVPRTLRARANVVVAYAGRAAELGLEDAAAGAVEAALNSHWDETLARYYGQLPRGRAGSRLATAEAWLSSHSASPALLVALGRLCREDGLWGKAEHYLHRAIAQGAGAEAWEQLGHGFASAGDEARARHCLDNALRVLRGLPAIELPGRGLREKIQDEAVDEERDQYGVPRLRD